MLVPKLRVSDWTIAHVLEWARKIVAEKHALKLKEQEVDGSALLLLTKEDLMKAGIPLGPAANLAAAIENLRAPTGTPFNYS